MNRMRPLIGITTSVNSQDYETSDQSVVMIPENYPKAVAVSYTHLTLPTNREV